MAYWLSNGRLRHHHQADFPTIQRGFGGIADFSGVEVVSAGRNSVRRGKLRREVHQAIFQPHLRAPAARLFRRSTFVSGAKESAVRIITFSMEPKDGMVTVKCDAGDATLTKQMPATAKLIRMAAVLDDKGELADFELVCLSQ